jgi:hypothetical protein
MDKIAFDFSAEQLAQIDIILDLALKQLGRKFVHEIMEIDEAVKLGELTKMQIVNLQYCLDVVLTRCGKSIGVICLMLDHMISKSVAAAREAA